MNTILLAAGLSARMGKQKLLLPFGESTVIKTVLSNLHLAGFSPVFAVFSREVAEAFTEIPEWLHIRINHIPERGQSSSLKIGLDMLPDSEDFCIMLGDLPLVLPEDLMEAAKQFGELPEDKSVLAPCRNGVFGHPMFYRAIWKERFNSAQGDSGGKKILLMYSEEILSMSAPDGHFHDIDTPDDYRKLIKGN